jgi:hypothetical protein
MLSCWIVDTIRIHKKIHDNHMNNAYKKILYNEYISYDMLIEQFGTDVKIRCLGVMLTNYYIMSRYNTEIFSKQKTEASAIKKTEANATKKTAQHASYRAGHKLIPMTLNDVSGAGDITRSVWNEVYTQAICSNLVLDMITPGLSIINTWSILSGIDETIYDNKASYDKYENSRKAVVVNNQIEESTKELTDIKQEEFAGVKDYIASALEYSRKNIILSPYALLITSEYCGRTIADTISIASNPEMHEASPRIINIFHNVDAFAKMAFEFVYTLFCINSKSGIMQGDLHLNNATIHVVSNAKLLMNNPLSVIYHLGKETETRKTNNIKKTNKNNVEISLKKGDADTLNASYSDDGLDSELIQIEDIADNPKINNTEINNPKINNPKINGATQIGPDVSFIFPYVGTYATIIDFSRSIVINDANIIKDFGTVYANKFMIHQRVRIIDLISFNLPDFYKQFKKEIERLIEDDIYIFGKALSVLDSYTLFSRIEHQLKQPQYKNTIKPADGVFKLLNTLISTSHNLLISNLNQIIKGFSKNTSDFDWPNRELLDVFIDYRTPPDFQNLEKWINKKTIDVYSYTNNIGSDIRSFSTYPPWSQMDLRMKHRKALNISTLNVEEFTKISHELSLSITQDEIDLSLGDCFKAPDNKIK